MRKSSNIQFIDLTLTKPSKKRTLEGISNLINRKNFIGGQEVEEFQKNFQDFNDSKYCLGVGNGTDAIEIALESLDLQRTLKL